LSDALLPEVRSPRDPFAVIPINKEIPKEQVQNAGILVYNMFEGRHFPSTEIP
jgi:hypothetical protein